MSKPIFPDFCVEALEEALSLYGKPAIFNTEQGSQFTSDLFTRVLKASRAPISMDARGHWTDNVFSERLWRSLNYECVFLKELESGLDAQREIEAWLTDYNEKRTHSELPGDRTLLEIYNRRLTA